MDTTDELRVIRARITLRDHQRLRETLAVVDEQGWDGEAGTALLMFVREDLVRPMVIGLGLRGAAASDAEATGWAVAWEELRAPQLHEAPAPWGVVWTAVRHAILGEVLAARYGTNPRDAWRIRSSAGPSCGDPRVIPCEDMGVIVDAGTNDDQPAHLRLSGILDPILEALVAVGWDRTGLDHVIEAMLHSRWTVAGSPSSRVGWRLLSQELSVAPWRMRRLVVALLGEPGWPGLIERVGQSGAAVLDEDAAREAMRATVFRSLRSPALQARRAELGEPRESGSRADRTPRAAA